MAEIKVMAEDTRQSYERAQRIYDLEGLSPTVLSSYIKGAGHDIRVVADIDMPGRLDMAKRIYSSDGKSPVMVRHDGGNRDVKIMSSEEDGDLVYRILTPRECWRLMGQPDRAYDAAAKVSSRTQLYNQAGNSIVVEVLRAIFRVVADAPPGSQSRKRLVQKSIDEWPYMEEGTKAP